MLAKALNRPSVVIDLLVHPRCPDTLVTHPIVEIHARDAWKNGRPSSYVADSITDTVLSQYDGVATPLYVHYSQALGFKLTHIFRSSVHLVDSLLQFAFAGLLLSYILDPPTLVVIDQGYLKNFGLRGVFLCIYSGSYLISKRTLQGIPFGILLLAFSMALPAVPMPGSGTFDLLLITFIFHVLLLHTPSLPTPLLLFRPQEVLPLAVLLWRSFTHTWLPILGFFFPVLFLATNLLSISLADVFLRQLALITAEIPQAPIETRAAFLTLYFLVLFIILTSLAMMVLVFSTTYLHTSSPNFTRWDRYGQPIGITARQTFIRSVIAYTAEPEHVYPFPTPINLAVWLFVRLPARIAHSSGWLSTNRLRQRGEQILWRGSIVPLTIIPTVAAWMLL
jgi:hypothetical protein